MTDQPITVDIDRIAESHRLLELAETFLLEATLWPDPAAAGELQRTAKHLSDLGRGVLREVTTVEVAEAYADAAGVILRNVQGARRFFDCILAPLRVPRPRSRG